MFCFGTEIGTENRGFSLVSVPNTEILVPWQHYLKQQSILQNRAPVRSKQNACQKLICEEVLSDIL